MTISVYWWNQKQGNIDPHDLDYQTSEKYEFISHHCVVGECSTVVQSHIHALRGKHQFYPDSWFIGDSECLKPVLEITRYSFEHYKHQGFGRAGLQRLFELSKQKGCAGRIHLHADKEGPAFYEHCGFVGLSAGQNGRKYFDPTPDNIAKLFSKQIPLVKMECTFREKAGASYMDPIDRIYHQLRQRSR